VGSDTPEPRKRNAEWAHVPRCAHRASAGAGRSMRKWLLRLGI
jgi:hypothetical protein